MIQKKIQFENQKMLDKITKHSQKVCQVFDVPTIAFRNFEHGLDIVPARKKWNRNVTVIQNQ